MRKLFSTILQKSDIKADLHGLMATQSMHANQSVLLSREAGSTPPPRALTARIRAAATTDNAEAQHCAGKLAPNSANKYMPHAAS